MNDDDTDPAMTFRGCLIVLAVSLALWLLIVGAAARIFGWR